MSKIEREWAQTRMTRALSSAVMSVCTSVSFAGTPIVSPTAAAQQAQQAAAQRAAIDAAGQQIIQNHQADVARAQAMAAANKAAADAFNARTQAAQQAAEAARQAAAARTSATPTYNPSSAAAARANIAGTSGAANLGTVPFPGEHRVENLPWYDRQQAAASPAPSSPPADVAVDAGGSMPPAPTGRAGQWQRVPGGTRVVQTILDHYGHTGSYTEQAPDRWHWMDGGSVGSAGGGSTGADSLQWPYGTNPPTEDINRGGVPQTVVQEPAPNPAEILQQQFAAQQAAERKDLAATLNGVQASGFGSMRADQLPWNFPKEPKTEVINRGTPQEATVIVEASIPQPAATIWTADGQSPANPVSDRADPPMSLNEIPDQPKPPRYTNDPNPYRDDYLRQRDFGSNNNAQPASSGVGGSTDASGITATQRLSDWEKSEASGGPKLDEDLRFQLEVQALCEQTNAANKDQPKTPMRMKNDQDMQAYRQALKDLGADPDQLLNPAANAPSPQKQ